MTLHTQFIPEVHILEDSLRSELLKGRFREHLAHAKKNKKRLT